MLSSESSRPDADYIVQNDSGPIPSGQGSGVWEATVESRSFSKMVAKRCVTSSLDQMASNPRLDEPSSPNQLQKAVRMVKSMKQTRFSGRLSPVGAGRLCIGRLYLLKGSSLSMLITVR